MIFYYKLNLFIVFLMKKIKYTKFPKKSNMTFATVSLKILTQIYLFI